MTLALLVSACGNQEPKSQTSTISTGGLIDEEVTQKVQQETESVRLSYEELSQLNTEATSFIMEAMLQAKGDDSGKYTELMGSYIMVVQEQRDVTTEIMNFYSQVIEVAERAEKKKDILDFINMGAADLRARVDMLKKSYERLALSMEAAGIDSPVIEQIKSSI